MSSSRSPGWHLNSRQRASSVSNPIAANAAAADLTLHNHVVMFDRRPMPADSFTLESEIAALVEHGEFRDMRHMLDASTVSRAVIGISYAQDFRPDAECVKP